jgi:hypothetical protein
MDRYRDKLAKYRRDSSFRARETALIAVHRSISPKARRLPVLSPTNQAQASFDLSEDA